MEFLNVGPGELLFILLLAILVVGPKRTVELAQQAGRLLARLQREWRAVQKEVMSGVEALKEEALQQDGLEEVLQEATTLGREFNTFAQEARHGLAAVQKETRRDVPPPPGVTRPSPVREPRSGPVPGGNAVVDDITPPGGTGG